MEILQRLYLSYKKLLARSNDFRLPHSLTMARRILFCLPRKEKDLRCVCERMDLLTDLFDQAHFSFSCESSLVRSFETDRHDCRLLVLDPDSLGVFSNPKGAFRRRLLAVRAQVAIDLDFEDNLVNALICLESGAPLRLGSQKRLGSPFYNLVVASGREKEAYPAALGFLLETIAELRGGRAA